MGVCQVCFTDGERRQARTRLDIQRPESWWFDTTGLAIWLPTANRGIFTVHSDATPVVWSIRPSGTTPPDWTALIGRIHRQYWGRGNELIDYRRQRRFWLWLWLGTRYAGTARESDDADRAGQQRPSAPATFHRYPLCGRLTTAGYPQRLAVSDTIFGLAKKASAGLLARRRALPALPSFRHLYRRPTTNSQQFRFRPPAYAASRIGGHLRCPA